MPFCLEASKDSDTVKAVAVCRLDVVGYVRPVVLSSHGVVHPTLAKVFCPFWVMSEVKGGAEEGDLELWFVSRHRVVRCELRPYGGHKNNGSQAFRY